MTPITPMPEGPARPDGRQVPRVAVHGLSKTYPGARALTDLDLAVMPGEVHGIVGQNGAGKSTFIRMLSGAEQPDSGVIEVDGAPIHFPSPHSAQKAGIFTVWQELSLVPHLSVAENICMGDLPRTAWGAVDWRAARARARQELSALGFDFDVRTPVQALPVAQRQAVEIAKAVGRNAKVILLDEPTATLSKPEVERLFVVLRHLQARGITLLYISHRMDELYEICQRVSVFRDGRRVGTYDVAGSEPATVVRAMLGRMVTETVDTADPGHIRMRALSAGKPLADVTLAAEGLGDGSVLNGVDLRLHAGEVLAVTGLAGNGQAELAACLFGARPMTTGRFLVNGEERRLKSPAHAIRLGIGLLPEERKSQGLVLGMSISSNVTMASLGQFTRNFVLQRPAERRAALRMRESLSIKTSTVSQPVGNLSGGNQQKVVLAKWLISGVKTLIIAEPTRGVDVGAKVEIYDLIRRFVHDGGSVLIITSELEEALMCDRAVVLKRGRVAGVVDRDQLDRDGESAILNLCS
ncbi:sugar ABC transporter ATP-binding protein [Streptomyces sp. NPDC056580]|uniref:sugar ABC transporter ATP-binding protein n=1 Tax=Streptomyces sp. NPDC056580 TaxID=3345872 RepID=UPI003680B3B9